MLVALAFHPGDEEQCLRLAKWIRELGPYPGHGLLLVADKRCSRTGAIRAEFDSAGFDGIEQLTNTSIIDGWPHAANFVFSMVARHIAATSNQPFLWLEPDCVTMRKGWLDALEAEYKSAGMPFLGDYVNVENVPPHCSGIAIYPGDLIAAGAAYALYAGDIAWDCAASEQILPKLHKTKQIGHAWKHPPFADQGEVDNLLGQHPEMVLFHADKSGSLIDLLRIKAQGGDDSSANLSRAAAGGQTAPAAEVTLRRAQDVALGGEGEKQHAVLGDTLTPRPSNTDIFIKTYPPDYPWLEYCLRSIEKFASGFRKTVIVYDSNGNPPETAEAPPPHLASTNSIGLIPVGSQPDGYLWQQVIKLDADKYSDAEWIVYMDSDTIFTKPVTPEILLGLPWMHTPYSDKMDNAKVWQWVTERFLKRPVEFEFMRRHPFVVPRWLLKGMRDFCQLEHGVSLDQYIMTCATRNFSEFNALGAYAYYHHHDKFTWLNTETTPPEQWPTLYVNQQWSRGGLTEAIKSEFNTILGGSDRPAQNEDRENKNGGGALPDNAVSKMQLQQDAPPSTLSSSVESRHATTERCEDGPDRGSPISQPAERSDARTVTCGNDLTSSGSSAPPAQISVRLSTGAAKWDRVEQLVLELRGYCDAPSHTGRVRKALVGAGIFPPVILGWLKQKKRKTKKGA